MSTEELVLSGPGYLGKVTSPKASSEYGSVLPSSPLHCSLSSRIHTADDIYSEDTADFPLLMRIPMNLFTCSESTGRQNIGLAKVKL